MSSIKQRRLNDLRLTSHPDLFVGDCVPFYFCPRSVMLYLIDRANYFEDRCDLGQIGEIDWTAVAARDRRSLKEGKQAEFLLERALPWHLIDPIGVKSVKMYHSAMSAMPSLGHRPLVEVRAEWYY